MFDTSYRAKQIAETFVELRRATIGAHQHLFELRHRWGRKDTLREVKYSTDLNFKHSVSTQLNFGFSGLIEEQWFRK